MINSQILLACKIMTHAVEYHHHGVGELHYPRWRRARLVTRFPAVVRKYEATLQACVNQGWLKSKRGPDGGYMITETGIRVTAHDIFFAFALEDHLPYLPLFEQRLAEMAPSEIVNAEKNYGSLKAFKKKAA